MESVPEPSEDTAGVAWLDDTSELVQASLGHEAAQEALRLPVDLLEDGVEAICERPAVLEVPGGMDITQHYHGVDRRTGCAS